MGRLRSGMRGARAASLALVALALPGIVAPAKAQQPTQAQISAIRQACRADYQAYCASVPTGGSAALACLKQNSTGLSPACRQAVDAVAGPAPAAAAPAPAKPAAGAPTPEAWPHTISANGASIVVYPPQATSWPGQTTLNARAAIAITRKGAAKPILGTVDVSAATRTDFNSRTVVFSDLKLLASHFPSLDTAAAAELEGKIRQAMAGMGPKSVPLDRSSSA